MASSKALNRSSEARQGEKLQILWNEIKRNRVRYVMIAPFMISFLLFVFLPALSSIILSFTNFNMLQRPDFVGYRNYAKLLLNDEVFSIAIRNTLLIAFITGPLSYLMCFILAWLINELNRPLRVFLTVVFYAPSISGNAYSRLIDWGFLQEPVLWLQDPKYIIWIIILVQLWLSLGVSFLAFSAGLQNVDRTLYEAGAIDGVQNRWQELWYITLPSMKPQLLFGAVMQITSSFSVGDVSMQLAGFPSVAYAGRTVLTHLIDYGTIRFEMATPRQLRLCCFFR